MNFKKKQKKELNFNNYLTNNRIRVKLKIINKLMKRKYNRRKKI